MKLIVAKLLFLGVALAQDITVGGSSTVYPISQAVVEEFHITHPNEDAVVLVNGTGAGFANLCDGRYAIAGASRPIGADEIQRCQDNGIDFVEVPIALDALSVVVNQEAEFVRCLNVDALKRIFEQGSEVRSWQEVDPAFPDEPLSIFSPGLDSGTYDYFTAEIVGGPSRSDVTTSESDEVLAQGVTSTPYAISYFGYAYAQRYQDALQRVAIDSGQGCVEPSLQTIKSGDYVPLTRPLFIYVNRAALEEPAVRALAKSYLTLSGQRFIRESGYALLAEQDYYRAQDRLIRGVTGSTFQDFKPGMKVGGALESSQ